MKREKKNNVNNESSSIKKCIASGDVNKYTESSENIDIAFIK